MRSAVPAILVSCKCDNPETARQIDIQQMEAACAASVKTVRTAENVPESARLCLSSILKAVLAHRQFGKSGPVRCLRVPMPMRMPSLSRSRSRSPSPSPSPFESRPGRARIGGARREAPRTTYSVSPSLQRA